MLGECSVISEHNAKYANCISSKIDPFTTGVETAGCFSKPNQAASDFSQLTCNEVNDENFSIYDFKKLKESKLFKKYVVSSAYIHCLISFFLFLYLVYSHFV